MSTTTTPTVTGMSPSKGSLMGNNMITITGSGFLNTLPLVNFGLAGGTNVKVVSDTVITVTNPNTSTAGPVAVTVLFNAVSFPVGNFTYMLPEVTGLNPSASSLAGGETITISGNYFTGAAAVNFGLAGASSIVVVSDTEITVTNPNAPKPGVTDVFVIVQGQSSEQCTADQFTYTNALAPGVPFLFASESLQDTYIQFLGGDVDGSYYDTNGTLQTLASNTAYSLMSIASNTTLVPNLPVDVPAVLINSFSGRLYVSLGAGLSGMNDAYVPAAQDSNDANYSLRYQYFEPTIKNSQLNVDLSYIDFTAISLSLTASNAPHSTNGNQLSQSSLSLATATGNAALIANGSVLPSPTDQLPSASFARVISPQLGASSMYHDFTSYLQTTLANTKVYLKGTYVGTGTQPTGNPLTQAQSYDYTGTFDAKGNVTLSPNSDSGNGFSIGVPTIQQGSGVGNQTGNIVITFEDLNAQTGIYGCNAPYSLNGGKKTAGITNDIYGQVVGDLLAGLNFGYVGSTIQFGNASIGSLCSTQWWGGTMPDGTVVTSNSTPGGQGIYFSRVQTNPLNYNSYAGSISSLTSGYGYPLQDRLGTNLLTMNTAADSGSYLMVWIDTTPVV